MSSDRLKALTDGVVAIIITIMVLEMRPPAGDTPEALLAILPTFLSYGLSFVFIAIYWNNHHHFFLLAPKVTGTVLWANLNLLFWMSLVPFSTGWMGEHPQSPWPAATYGITLLSCALAWRIMQAAIISSQGARSLLRRAVGGDWKGKASAAGYVLGIGASFLNPTAGASMYAGAASLWLIPDRRVRRVFLVPDLGDGET